MDTVEKIVEDFASDIAVSPFSSGTSLREMIRAIRACKTAAEERAVVRRECAAIRTAISENEPELRHRNMAKLMFIHMLGYPTHFAQMECLKLIAAAGFPEKRVGYLGLMLLLDERQEVLMLVTNSLKQDLNHTNQFIVGLALCALGNICSAEMARDLSPEVERLMRSREVNTKKKNCIEGLARILRDVSNRSYAPEYDVSGIVDPFLHIRVLKLLRILGQGDADCSEYMNDILAQVATKTESNKNAGNAILYECVQTIMGIEATSGLRVLAINILGRFLSNRDNNIRYVALNMLMRAITVDALAVQRHRTTILECVKDADASIRKRALELVYLLVNDTNVKPLTKELIDYLNIADPDFIGDLTVNICSIVEKFSQEKLWYLDQMFNVLSLAGNHVKDDICHALIVVLSNTSELQGYSVRSLYKALQEYGKQGSLVRVAVWCIGEYGEMLVNNVGMLDGEEPIKVSGQFLKDMFFVDPLKRIKQIVAQNKGNVVLELQQRSIEFTSIIQRHQSIRSSLLERMPVLDEASYLVKRATATQSTISADKIAPTVTPGSLKLPNGVAKPTSAPLADLLDFSSDGAPASTVASTTTPNDFLQDLLGIGGVSSSTTGVTSTASTDILMDLLSIGSSPSQNGTPVTDFRHPGQESKPVPGVPEAVDLLGSLSPAESKPTPVVPKDMDLLDGLSSNTSISGHENTTHPSITAFQSATLKITFDFKMKLGNPRETTIHATFTNLTSSTFTDFIFQAAVPKKPLAMRIRMSYKVNGEDRLEQGQVSNFPSGL
ncbi:AP-1 complex subunit gamma-1 [Zea mays]|uniref:AP-1 complex subunit gamma n=1 Tax=Zea mays TaxID=4577 RepID=A0A1D6QBT8_MAIZE|nr:AP-1 complex subunit gamma-1 [Zea mays]